MKTLFWTVLLFTLVSGWITYEPEPAVGPDEPVAIAVDFMDHAFSPVLEFAGELVSIAYDHLLEKWPEEREVMDRDETSAVDDTDTSSDGLDRSGLDRIAENAVVTVVGYNTEGRGGQGTGFLIDSGHVVTNEHVVRERGDITVEFQSGERIPARVVGSHVAADLAFLHPKRLPDEASLLELSSRSVVPEQPVYSIGSPGGRAGTVATGSVHEPRVRITNESPRIGFSIAAAPGSSGSPVLDRHAAVVGVISGVSADGQMAFAVPSSVLNGLVQHIEPVGR